MSYREPCVPFEIGQTRVKLWRRSEPRTPESEDCVCSRATVTELIAQ